MRTITDIQELHDMAVGDEILVGQADPVTWAKVDDDLWQVAGTNDDLRTSIFISSINAGLVQVRTPPQEGEWYYDGSRWYYVARGGDEVLVGVWGRSDGRWQGLTHDLPDDLSQTELAGVSGSISRQVTFMPDILAGYDARQRLARVIEHGVPEATDKVVTIKVVGHTQTQVDTDALTQGHGVTITNALPTVTVQWEKNVQVTVSSPWECACNEVDLPDLGADLTVDGYEVLGCEAVAS